MSKYNVILTEKLSLPVFDHTALGVEQLPPMVDMEPHMAPVFDQGQLGSCTGNAFVGAVEYMENKKNGFTNTDAAFIGLSRLYVYYNERLLEGTVSQDSGALISDGLRAIQNYGVCKETLWPYNISQFTVKPSQDAYTDGETRKSVDAASLAITQDAFLTTLAAGYPIVIGMQVFQSMESPEVAQTGMVPLPGPSEQDMGGHAVLVSGYDMSKQLLKVRNSWGAGWGDNGYFYLPFAYGFQYGYITDAAVIRQMQ